MQTPATTTGTEAPHNAGFPPFKTESFPSQIFWLTISFAVLFVVLWRIAGPRLAVVIAARKDRIDGDLAAAAQSKMDAEAAEAAYQAAMAAARAGAHKTAEETRKRIEAEVEKAKAEADTLAKEDTVKAEARITEQRVEAAEHVTKAAQDAATAIVARLIGDTVSPEEAWAALERP